MPAKCFPCHGCREKWGLRLTTIVMLVRAVAVVTRAAMVSALQVVSRLVMRPAKIKGDALRFGIEMSFSDTGKRRA